VNLKSRGLAQRTGEPNKGRTGKNHVPEAFEVFVNKKFENQKNVELRLGEREEKKHRRLAREKGASRKLGKNYRRWSLWEEETSGIIANSS